jgi:hypothetical protein
MPDKFDPYYRWLGIPPKEQPPNHYRLLGIELFESDPQLIDSFSLRHTDFLREITDGPHLPDAQRLLNELAAARRCLLDPQRKAAYDAELRDRLAAGGKPAANADAAAPPPSEPAVAIVARNEPQPASEKTASRRPKPSRPPIWILAGSVAVTLVAIGLTAAVATRSKPARPAAATARVPKDPNRANPTNASATAPKPTAAPTPEPISEPDDVEPHHPAKPEPPDSESTATAATIKPPEIQSAPGFFIPEGQAPRLPGLVLWLDASQLPPTSDPIARWANSAGGDFETQQKQASRRPEILAEALQGKAVARFRGAQCLEISKTSDAMNLGSDFTFAYVARGVAGTLLSKGAGGKAGQFSLLSDSCFLTNGEVNPQSNGRLAAAADDPTQFRARTIAADASGLTWFVDGTASGSYTDDRHEIQNERTLRIGSAWFRSGQEDAAGFFVGDLAELLIYSRALPEDERQRVEAYLREKWLAGDTPPAPLDLVAPTPASPPAEDVAPDNLAATAAAETAPESAAAPAAEFPLAETGQIRREVWRNFRGIDLDAVHQLWDAQPEPDLSEAADRLEGPTDFDDHYCQRFRGFLQPPLTGDYTFTVRANEEGVLFVSTDEQAENKRQVTFRDKVPLTAGRAYYVEAIHWEKGGKDYFSVGWKLPDGKEENPIPGQRLSLRDRPIPPHEIGFVALTPVRAEASGGSQLQVLDDGTVMAEGAATENEVYSLAFEIAMPKITAIQLQAVPHESLPGGGPGRGLGGSFRLAEVQAGIAPADSDDTPQATKFREVLTADGDTGATRLIDGKPATLWSCRRGGQPVSLTFLPAEPIVTSGAAVLHVTLHNRDPLGCLRLLATSMPEPRKLASTASQPAGPARSDLFSLFVNLGGGPWQDPAGNSWVASKDFDGATYGHEAGQTVESDAVDHPLYNTAVRKLTGFRAVVPNGEYSVELHFQEHWSKNPADRAFAVAIEQQPVLRPPMFFQGPGMGQPYVHPIPRVIVKDGRLDVDFSPVQPDSLTILNGIAIRQLR